MKNNFFAYETKSFKTNQLYGSSDGFQYFISFKVEYQNFRSFRNYMPIQNLTPSCIITK